MKNMKMMANFMSQYKRFMQDPMGALRGKFNIPQNINNTSEAQDYLFNSKDVPQEKKDQANMMFNMFQN